MVKKNVIFITIDGARLDRVKQSKVYNRVDSVFFSQCVTYGPHTIVAMHAIFSGCYGSRTGTNSYWSTFNFKKERFHTITEYLKENNYHTYADIHSEIVIPRQGFDEFIVYDKDEDLSQRHCELLEKMKKTNESDQPFFLHLHYAKIHSGITDSVLKKYTNFSKEYFENRNRNEEHYDNLFRNSEQYLDTILKKIKNENFDTNSIILILSDHGISVGEKFGEKAYGAFCYDYTIMTFGYFIGEWFKNKEITQQIRTVDLLPTILDYLEISLHKNFELLDGISLRPLIEGKIMKELPAFSETGNPLNEKKPPKLPNTKSIRTSKWKLIYNEYDDTKEMYDLISDPDEKTNLIKTGLAIEQELWNALQKFMKV